MNTYNLKEIKNSPDASFEAIPEGRYNLEVADATAGISKSEAKNEIINIKFKIIDGDFKGRVVWDTLTLTKASYWKIKRFLLAANSTLEDEKINPEGIAMGIIGLKVSAFLEPGNDNNGNPRSNPREYQSIETVAPPATPGKKSSLLK